MTLRLTPSQYRTLVRALFLARRVVEGAELQEDTAARDVKSLVAEVHSLAHEFGADAMFDGDPKQGAGLVPAEENTLVAIAEWYEEFAFWDILEERLAMRDIAASRTEAQWNWLPESEKNKIYDQHLDFYYEEFATRGIQNLRLVEAEEGSQESGFWVPTFAGEEAEPGFEVSPGSGTPGGGKKIIEFPGKPKRRPEDQEP